MKPNHFALYNFRSRLPDWLEARAKRVAATGSTQRALHLIELMYRAHSRVLSESPFGIEPFGG